MSWLEQKELWVLIMNIVGLIEWIEYFQDPSMLATLTSKELEMLKSISQDDLAPPPSQEDIFGQIDAVKKQFEEDHELIARQFEENKVIVRVMIGYVRKYYYYWLDENGS